MDNAIEDSFEVYFVPHRNTIQTSVKFQTKIVLKKQAHAIKTDSATNFKELKKFSNLSGTL